MELGRDYVNLTIGFSKRDSSCYAEFVKNFNEKLNSEATKHAITSTNQVSNLIVVGSEKIDNLEQDVLFVV